MPQKTIHALIDRWLSQSAVRLRLRFPGPVEQLFEADTGPERCRDLTAVGVFGCLVGLLFYRPLVHAMPDVADMSRTLYLEAVIPVAVLTVLLMRLGPTPVARECLQWFSTVFCACCVTYLFASSEAANETLYVAGEMVLVIYCTLGVQLRFGYAVAATLCVLAAYGAGLSAMTALSTATRYNLMLLACVAGCCALLANWRLEYGMRRSYLLMLGEKLRRQDLSMRNRELNELVQVDPLTGLANRRAYDRWLETAWAGALPEAGLVGLVIIDIDKFKAYNDFYGHAGGDVCLQTVARCLREQLRGTSDFVARLGGEEFAALLPGLPLDICGDIAERLRLAVQGLELPHVGIGPGGLVTISAGVASVAATHDTSAEDVFAAADEALYAAKEAGRNQVGLAGQAHSSPLQSGVLRTQESL
jgi:diguanylate cyclase (GGDEF)-like protein